MRREINVTTGEITDLPDAPLIPVTPVDLFALDTAALNAALAQDGSVVRALAEVMFSEINILRTAAGQAVRTKPQFVAALKAQMRT